MFQFKLTLNFFLILPCLKILVIGSVPQILLGVLAGGLLDIPILSLLGISTMSLTSLFILTQWSLPDMGSSTLSHNMSYATAQAMFYLVTGAQRI